MTEPRAPAGEAVRCLYAESKIRAALARYCRGVNRLDFDLVASVFHPGARNEHGAYHGEPAHEGHETQKSSGVRYIDRFERRTGDDWLIARRLVVVEWRRELGIEALRAAGPDAPAGPP